MQHIILAYNVNKDTFLANVVLATELMFAAAMILFSGACCIEAYGTVWNVQLDKVDCISD